MSACKYGCLSMSGSDYGWVCARMGVSVSASGYERLGMRGFERDLA